MTRKANTIADQVYGAVRSNIMALKIEPGTAMSEKEISEKLSVSRTPVREAFIRLSKEGLVTIYPQRGTYVSKISIVRAKEERFLRESLETAVLEVFMQRHSPEVVERLKENVRMQKQILEQCDWDRFMKYDDEFHAAFYEETGKNLCYDIVKNSNVDYYRLRCLSILVSEGIAVKNLDQHLELLEEIERGDTAAASGVLRRHLRRLFSEIEEMQDKYPSYFRDEDAPNLAQRISDFKMQ